MAKMDDAVLARLKKEGYNFEIYVDPFLAWDFRHGDSKINFDDLIAFDTVYSDAKKAKEASKEILKKVFKTEDFTEIAKEIIYSGEVQLTTVQRHQLTEKREKEIINFIANNAHDPKTMTPIPVQRIVNAFEELKIKVNLSKKKDEEIKEIIKKLQKVMPLSLEKIIIEIEVPATHAGKCSSIIYKYEVIDQKWLSNGGLFAKIKIPAGIKTSLISNLNNITHGDIKVVVEE